MVISWLYMLGINRNVLKIVLVPQKQEKNVLFVYTPSLKIHFFSNSNIYKMYNTVSVTAGFMITVPSVYILLMNTIYLISHGEQQIWRY